MRSVWTGFRTFHTPLFICLNSVNLLKFKIEISQLKQLNCRTL